MTFNVPFFLDTFKVTLSAVPETLKLTFISFLVAVPVAFLFAITSLRERSAWKMPIKAYISLVRGTPTIVQIFAIYSILPGLFAYLVSLTSLNVDVYGLNAAIYAYIIFSINTTASLTEVFRSAILTVDRGQFEAGYACGMTRFQTYIHIVGPQALTSAMPNLCNIVTTLVKTTSLAFVMSVKEITAAAKIQASFGYNYFEAYLDVWIVYIMLILLIETGFKYIERRLVIYKNA